MLSNLLWMNDGGYYTISKKLWAKPLRIYTLDSIAEHITIEKLNPVTALAYFLCAQETSIIGMELCDNAHIQNFWRSSDRREIKFWHSNWIIKKRWKAVWKNPKMYRIWRFKSNDKNQKICCKWGTICWKQKRKLSEEEEGKSVTPIAGRSYTSSRCGISSSSRDLFIQNNIK